MLRANLSSLGLDTTTAGGKLMLNVFGAVAQFEREMMLERQREGVAKAKAEGKYKGRKPTARNKGDQIMALSAQGWSRLRIADELKISESSVYRVLADRLGHAITERHLDAAERRSDKGAKPQSEQ
jgi:DNA invertase Pin-like site-specific DNA recombinase